MTEVHNGPRGGAGWALLRGFGVAVFATLWMVAAHQVFWAYVRVCEVNSQPGYGFVLVLALPLLWLVFVGVTAFALAQVRRKQWLRIGLAVLGMVLLAWGYWVLMIRVFAADVSARCRADSPWWSLLP